MFDKKLVISVLVALVVGVFGGAFFFGGGDGQFAPTAGRYVEDYIPAIKFNQGYLSQLDIQTTGTLHATSTDISTLTVDGTDVEEIRHGTCNLSSTASFGATSTLSHTCTATGVASGDRVFVTLPSAASAGTFGGFAVSGATAGSGSITVVLQNLTGAATSSYAQATTSVMYWAVN